MRFFLLDKVTELTLGQTASAVKCVTLTDEVLHDHFPNHPIYPGVLIVEGLAQLGGCLVEASVNTLSASTLKRAVMVKLDKISFLNPCGPGDRLTYRATIEALSDDAAKLSVEASCEGEARVKGAITYVLTEVADAQLSAQRVSTYKLWTRGLANAPQFR